MTTEATQELQDSLDAAKRELEAVNAEKTELERKLAESVKTHSVDDTTKAINDAAMRNDTVYLKAQLDQLQEQARKATEEKDELSKRYADESQARKVVEEAMRVERNTKLADTCRLPAMRPFIAKFMDLATRDGNVAKVYSDTARTIEIDATKVVEDCVKWINEQVSLRLFNEQSRSDDYTPREKDPGTEVHNRVKAYQLKNQGAEYNVALRAVLDEDASLKEAYARSNDA